MPFPSSTASLPLAGVDLPFVLGAYGAALSTLLAISQLLRDRPGVKLRLTPTNVEYAEGPEYGQPTRDFWEVRVVNHRKRPITIRRGGLLGDRGQRVNASIVDPFAQGGPRLAEPFPKTLTDGTSFSFYIELDFRRDCDRMGAYVEDDLDRDFRVYSPSFSPRRRYAEWKSRRRFEKALGEKATLLREWRPWRWRRPRW